MFTYVVETERRFYLANDVEMSVRNEDGRPYFESSSRDAWVWDMYRPARFVAASGRDVQGRQRRGAPREGALTVADAPPVARARAGEDVAAAWYASAGLRGRSPATGAAARASST